MNRNLKALGLALVAAFAMSAVAASTASARFVSPTHETELTAKALNVQTFTTGESEVTCTEVGVEKTTIGTEQTEITAKPVYGGHCTIKQGGSTFTAKVDMNGCHYQFTTHTSVHIQCPVGQQIKVTAFILGAFRECLDIGAQTPTDPTVHYINGTDPSTGKMDVTVESTVKGITYTKTGLCGSLHANDAHYLGNVTVTGHNPSTGAAVDVTHTP